jgi:hypothetical protein
MFEVNLLNAGHLGIAGNNARIINQETENQDAAGS